MTEVVCQMYADGQAWPDAETLYANRAFLLANRRIIERNPELFECHIPGVFLGVMYCSGPDIDFLHLLEEWEKPDSPLVQLNENGNACFVHGAGGSPLSGSNRCHAYCPVENAHYILHYKSLHIPLRAMAAKRGTARRPEPYRPTKVAPGSFLEFSRQSLAAPLPAVCYKAYNPSLSLGEVLMVLRAEGKAPTLADRVATVARLCDDGLYLQLQGKSGFSVMWVYDAADMTQARRAYCVGLDDWKPLAAPPTGVPTVHGLELWHPTEQELADLRRVLADYSRHWGGISVADFAHKQASDIASRTFPGAV